jgi:hypothetical protein
MATRSTIALEYPDGTVRQIYCLWDGYLSNNGKILSESYRDFEKVKQLIDHGDISSLDDSIEKCHFYGRDNGESNVNANVFGNFEDYVMNHAYEEYEYIFRTDGKWYVNKTRFGVSGYIDLEEAIAKPHS